MIRIARPAVDDAAVPAASREFGLLIVAADFFSNVAPVSNSATLTLEEPPLMVRM